MEFCGCLGIDLRSIWWFVFWVLDASILRHHNFLNSIPFWTIFSALNTPIGRVQVLFKCQKQWNPPLGSGMPWRFKCYNCNSIPINEQLKDLTHMFCFWIPCYKLYKEGLLFHILTLKYKCHFGMSSKKFLNFMAIFLFFYFSTYLCR